MRQKQLKDQGIEKELTPDDLKTFLLHNTYSTPKDHGHPPGIMPRCHHCASLTDGVRTTPGLQHADAHPNDPEHR